MAIRQFSALLRQAKKRIAYQAEAYKLKQETRVFLHSGIRRNMDEEFRIRRHKLGRFAD